ncbi:MAG: hypothetical protein O2970_05475 [Proteobacteria bacterium]|nr:hypothetical protein [Pseudomonadota bacterium]
MIAGGNIRGVGAACAQHQISSALCWQHNSVALYLNVGRPPPLGFFGITYNDGIGTHSPIIYSSIDSKIDDGIPTTGKFLSYRAWMSSNGNCLTGLNGSYLLTNDSPACFAKYVLQK